MVVFGLILLIVALAVIAYMWLATAGMDPVSIDYGFLNIELSPLWLFFAGGITLAVATSGLWLMGVGAKTGARRAREMRELRKQAKEADRRAERDRDRAALGSSDDRGPARGDRTIQRDRGTGHGTGPGSSYGDRGRSGDTDGPILPRPGTQQRPTGPTGTPGQGSSAPGSSGTRPAGTEGTPGRDGSLDIDR